MYGSRIAQPDRRLTGKANRSFCRIRFGLQHYSAVGAGRVAGSVVGVAGAGEDAID